MCNWPRIKVQKQKNVIKLLNWEKNKFVWLFEEVLKVLIYETHWQNIFGCIELYTHDRSAVFAVGVFLDFPIMGERLFWSPDNMKCGEY